MSVEDKEVTEYTHDDAMRDCDEADNADEGYTGAVPRLRAYIERLEAMCEWLARRATTCLEGRDCPTFFEDDKEATCKSCREKILAAAREAVEK